MMKKSITMLCLFIGIAITASSTVNAQVPDPVKKAKVLQKELKLTDKQTEKIAVVYKESADKYEKIKAEEHGNTNKMAPKLVPLRSATITKIKEILTPAESAKFDKLLKDSNKSSTSGGWSDGWSSVPAN